tara:strand:- start:191 stop:478 length:288 start_codon:yes stop_codon:yes gene_type:complete
MEDILNRIRNNCHFLTTLDLSNKNINDETAFLLADALKTNTRLKKLNLCNNPIGDNGRFALANAVKGKSIKLSFVKNFIVVGEKDVIYHIISSSE